MPLIVKIGGKESNSFVTLAEAEEYMVGLFTETELTQWENLEDSQKEYRLRLAAELVKYFPLRGVRVFCGQVLCFPRDIQNNVHMIPEEVKETQCFIAYNVIHKGLENRPDPSEAESGARVSSVSLGGLLSVSFAGTPVAAGMGLDKAIRSSQFPAYMMMSKYMTQIKGGSVDDADELAACLTTTTTSSTTTTTTV